MRRSLINKRVESEVAKARGERKAQVGDVWRISIVIKVRRYDHIVRVIYLDSRQVVRVLRTSTRRREEVLTDG